MDITLDKSVLIFDEAHNIEDTARYTSSSSHSDALWMTDLFSRRPESFPATCTVSPSPHFQGKAMLAARLQCTISEQII